MRSAREFCREPGFPITIFLTYSFDPLFFERVPLSDLGVGGSKRIVIVADGAQVTTAMNSCVDQIVHLGRKYVLAETNSSSTFHPKLILRLSREGGRVWIGSGNLTFTGWGGNRELASVWSIGPKCVDKGLWVNELLREVASVVRSTTLPEQIAVVRAEIAWLRDHELPHDTATNSPILFQSRGRSLSTQLAQRWRGRRFQELFYCTGSTDANGAFLRWAHETFGIKRATVCVNPHNGSFDPVKLARLPIDIRIVDPGPNEVMHAKFCWFSGPKSRAAVVGSANCSAAAWLAHGDAANFELIIPYDEPEQHEFDHVLKIFAGNTVSVSQAFTSHTHLSADVTAHEWTAYSIVSMRLRTNRLIEVVFDPELPDDAYATLILKAGTSKVSLVLTSRGKARVALLPAEFPIGLTTLFGRAQGDSNGQAFATGYRWVDNDAVLDRSANPRAPNPDLDTLSRDKFDHTTDHKILEAVQSVASSLLLDRRLLSSMPARSGAAITPKSTPTSGTGSAEPIDPHKMLRNLSEIAKEKHSLNHGPARVDGLSLTGIIGMLFGEPDQPDIDLKKEIWSATDTGEEHHEDTRSIDGSNSSIRGDAPKRPAPTESIVLFKRLIRDFLSHMAKPSFADSCDPERLVQALAFPLLLCIRGSNAGWLSDVDRGSIATDVTDIMLSKFYGKGRPIGLLRVVQARHSATAQAPDFQQAIGDGSLWVALLAILSAPINAPVRTLIRQAVALRDALNCNELLSQSNEQHLSALSQSLQIKDAPDNLMVRSPKILAVIDDLSALMLSLEPLLLKQQGGKRLQAAGSVLWNRHSGWMVTPTTPAQSYYHGFLNVELAANSHPRIAEHLSALRAAYGGARA